MQTTTLPIKKLITVLTSVLFFVSVVFFQSCKKDDPQTAVTKAEELAEKKGGNPHNPPPPPPPPPFYFSDCYNPVFSASFTQGVPTNTTIVKHYINSPGGSYGAFTSATVNGITITAPAGTFNVGSGSVTFTATGTPVSTGYCVISIWVGSIQPCQMQFTVGNAPVSGPTADPGPTAGSTGIINFTYKGQAVAYKTVRTRDGKIWLQQNLGSPQVAFHHSDQTSFGDYFQWGRWDDGHQDPNSQTISGGPSLLNPSHIPAGNPNFIIGSTVGNSWWGTGGLATDTWSGSSATSTNGKDPCAALGAGWRSPTQADWQSVKNHEDLEGAMAAFGSNLKLPIAGYRSGSFFWNNGESYYWSATALNTYATCLFISDNTYSATLQAMERWQGLPCRCMKD